MSPSEVFLDLVKVSGTQLTPHLYDFIKQMHTNEEYTRQPITKAKIRKQSNLLPNLVFQVEEYEGILVKIGKRHKINLLSGFRRSTARDFRIMQKELTAIRTRETQEPKVYDNHS
jgi:hypothetical protein